MNEASFRVIERAGKRIGVWPLEVLNDERFF